MVKIEERKKLSYHYMQNDISLKFINSLQCYGQTDLLIRIHIILSKIMRNRTQFNKKNFIFYVNYLHLSLNSEL